MYMHACGDICTADMPAHPHNCSYTTKSQVNMRVYCRKDIMILLRKSEKESDNLNAMGKCKSSMFHMISESAYSDIDRSFGCKCTEEHLNDNRIQCRRSQWQTECFALSARMRMCVYMTDGSYAKIVHTNRPNNRAYTKLLDGELR